MLQYAQKWEEITKKIDAMSVRERMIMCGTLAVALWVSIMVLGIEPILKQTAATQSEISKIKASIAESQSTLKILSIEYSFDPNTKPRERLRELTHQLRRIEGDIQSKSTHMVPSKKTTEVLQEILASQNNLYLVNLEKLQPIAVPISDGAIKSKGEAAAEIAAVADAIESQDIDHVKALLAVVENTDPFLKKLESQTNVYKHGVRLELQGQFLDVLNYMIALEKMDWKVYWKSFQYKAENYPVGKASFVIETLGFDNGWIGV